MDEVSVRRPRTWLGALLDPSQWLTPLYLSDCNRVGAGTRAMGRPLIYNQGRIDIGRDCVLRSFGSPVRLTTMAGGTISIGDRVIIDSSTRLFADKLVRIEDGVVLGPNVTVCDRDESGHVGEVVVEANARIGAGARLIGPCRIGRSAVVHAGSVARGQVADGAVVRSAEPKELNGTSENHASNARRSELNGTDGAKEANFAAVSLPTRNVSAVLVADFTINELAGLLAAPEYDGLAIEAEVAPFDQVVPSLMALKGKPQKTDVVVVWTRPDRTCPSFRDLLSGERPDVDRIFAEVDAFCSQVKAHADGARIVLIPSWVLPPGDRGVGLLAMRGSHAASLLMRMNLRLADAFVESPNVFLLDAQRWMATARDGAFDAKLWLAGKVAFTTDVFSEAARDIFAAVRGALGMARKLVVVDLDDTVWGGVVGDVGWEGLRLGGHDPNGEAFVEFQRRLLALTKRGIALAVVSKNEESTALEAMRLHPEMILRPEMLAAFRINWRDKAQNIVEIAKELNLGLQSVVFIDDNPVERGRVHEALPEVYVPAWPIDPTRYPGALESMTCFDSAHISAEDLERNAMYATERERTSLRNRVSTLDEWLATLNMAVRFEALGRSNLPRVAQLLNKTNQMNLRTRRLTEVELEAWAREPGHEVWAVHVSDRFGDAGLTGILGLGRRGDEVHVEDYVLSCRVMGRRVEEVMVWAAKRRGAALGAQNLVIAPIATAKNKPCLDFFEKAGHPRRDDGYLESVALDEPSPSLVAITGMP